MTPTPTPTESAHDRHLPGPEADRRTAEAQPRRAEGALAGVLRGRAAGLPPRLPGPRPRASHPGADLRRAEAGLPGAARCDDRGHGEAERRRPARAAAAPGCPPARGHQAAARVAGRDARGDGHRRRLRAPGQALPEPLGGRPRDHRHPVVRAAVLRPAQDRERRDEPTRGQAQGPLRGLHPQVQRGGPRAGLQQPRRPARGLRCLHRQPAP